MSVVFVDNFIEDPINHCVNEIVERNQLVATYHQPARFGMRSLNQIKKPEKIIVLGSASNVTKPEVWHEELLKWLMPEIENGVPTLGICFGHQLFVDHFGGVVDFIDEQQTNYKIIRSIVFNKTLWGHEFRNPFPMPYAHQQVVKSIPDSFEVLGSSDQHEFEVLKHKTLPLWTLQGHPESSEAFLAEGLGLEDYNELKTIKSLGNQFIDLFINENLP